MNSSSHFRQDNSKLVSTKPTARKTQNSSGHVPSDKVAYRVPVSARGKRTRSELIESARVIFERDGFADSRIVDITAVANTSTGTFYTYFKDKEDVLEVVLTEAQDDMLHTAILAHDDQVLNKPVAVLEAAFTAYLRYYNDNVALMLLIEQVAGIDPDFRTAKRNRELESVRQNAEVVREWRDRGLANFDLDPFLATSALSGMVNRFAYNSLALAGHPDLPDLAKTVTGLWVKALGLSHVPASTHE